jgi:hypothetical protein
MKKSKKALAAPTLQPATIDDAIKNIDDLIDTVRDYPADTAVVYDDDLSAYRSSVDTENKLIIIHGGTLPFYDQAAAFVGEMFTNYEPGPTLVERIKKARVDFPRILNYTLGLSSDVNAKAMAIRNKLLAMKQATVTNRRVKIAAIITGGAALAMGATAFFVHRHHRH